MLHEQSLKSKPVSFFFFFFSLALSRGRFFGTANSAHILMFYFIFQPIFKRQAVKFWTCAAEGIKGLRARQVAWKPLRPF